MTAQGRGCDIGMSVALATSEAKLEGGVCPIDHVTQVLRPGKKAGSVSLRLSDDGVL